jgi:anti-sigma-K factor RskA
MVYTDDHIALAAEYALGTLDADERAQVEAMMAVDKGYADIVQAWQFKLGSLNQMVGSIEPRPILWEGIKAGIGKRDPEAPVLLPETPPTVAPVEPVASDAPAIEPEPDDVPPPAIESAAPFVPAAPVAPADASNVARLSSQVRRWRSIASAAMAIAAALVAMITVQLNRPELLPDGLRPRPRTQVVEVKTPATPVASAQFVALLQKDGASPAFILTIDEATRSFTVRRVGATPEAGKSYELWLVSDKLPRPRSLGVIGGNDFTTRPSLSAYDPDLVSKASFAVSIEPEGGSPTGNVTGPIVYSGKLIETVPATAAPRPGPKK